MRRIALAFACASAFAAVPASAANHDVSVGGAGFIFSPSTLTITAGDTVTFTNNDTYIHQVYVDGLFDSAEKAPGENLNETFPNAGTFQVRCHIHPTMKMTVRVR